jgi:hypothetical protein
VGQPGLLSQNEMKRKQNEQKKGGNRKAIASERQEKN